MIRKFSKAIALTFILAVTTFSNANAFDFNKFNPFRSGPEDVISSYLSALTREDYEAAYNFLTSKNKEAISLQNFTNLVSVGNIFKETLDDVDVSFSIEGLNVTGSEASAKIKVTHPEVSSKIKSLVSKGGDVKMTTTYKVFNLAEGEDGWKVVFN